jgi:hypothetical protein
MEGKERYLQFPLFLLRELLTNKEKTLNDIISYGIYNKSKSQKYDINIVATQLMYVYYRKRGDLTNNLIRTIQNYIDEGSIEIDEDYNGFSGENFNPETEVEQLLQIFETNTNFYGNAIEFFQMKQAYNYLGINGSYSNCLKAGKEIEKDIPEKEPFPMVSISLLFNYRDNNKTEFELMQFASYVAIRSILGKKAYCRTNKEMIVCRAFGYSSIKTLPTMMNKVIKPIFDKYINRYWIDKVLINLELNWEVLTYSNNMRGMCIGMKNKTTIEDLALIAETKKMKNRIAKLKDEKREAREKALQQLNKGVQLNKGADEIEGAKEELGRG